MSYSKSPVPSTGNPVLEKYLDNELSKIQAELALPEFRGIRLQVMGTAPTKYKKGDLYWAPAGVLGANEGLYIYDISSWRRL